MEHVDIWEECHPEHPGVRLNPHEAVALGLVWWEEFEYLNKCLDVQAGSR